MKLAFVVSHPIQYYAPLYQRLGSRRDVAIKVFFTWHAGLEPVPDRGFGETVQWDIPLTDGYPFEAVPNLASDPGTHHALGLHNPMLCERVLAWKPDAVHITGWKWRSHFVAMRTLSRRGIPMLFRGDSHLLNASRQGAYWHAKRAVLRRVYSWPAAFLYVGSANRRYYQEFGVNANRLFACPHSIDVARFAEPADRLQGEADRWRHELGIASNRTVLLFAGKFEPVKRPLELIRAVQGLENRNVTLLMIGGGPLDSEVRALAGADPDRVRVLPFQNQSRMPLVYRLGDALVLPSISETWGLAVNEALACARPVVVSDSVGCAEDVVTPACGRVFSWSDEIELKRVLHDLCADRAALVRMRPAAAERARDFDISRTETTLMECVEAVAGSSRLKAMPSSAASG